ncbi:MAG: transporter [Xanthobacteraceae bacterium]|nr:transporter [Xanthobacteraceae bacterium]
MHAPAANALKIDGVSKSFNDVHAVKSCSLEVRQGEIISLLGASGCGKTTLLNLIAGFELPDSGTIQLGGRDITVVPPHQRRTGMVFQHYALFPHMTVQENILYGPKVQGASIEGLAAEMAGLLKIEALLQRYPSQLSGGQRQRVAVARALAVKPEILLLDEAFSALDRNLREEMQIELSLLLRRLGITTILVTHDQREAFSLSDRIAVMDGGQIGQIGSAKEVYRQPASSFVFGFLGSSNRMSGSVVARNNAVTDLRIAEGLILRCNAPGRALGSEMCVGVRAESVQLARQPTAVHRSHPATVSLATFLGQTVRSVVQIEGLSVVSETIAAADIELPVAGDLVFLDIAETAVHVLDNPGVPL